MSIIAHIVRRATAPRVETVERPKVRTRAKSPRARLREDALTLLS